MIRGYKSFRESKNNTDIKWGIDILTELEEVFIDLEDDLGFNIVPSIKIGDNSYSTDGSIIFTYYRSNPLDCGAKISISKDRIELDQLETVSDIIISKILSIGGLVSGGIEIDRDKTSMRVFSEPSRTFRLYRNYKNGREGLYWAFLAWGGGNVSFSEAVKGGLFRDRTVSFEFELIFNLIDR